MLIIPVKEGENIERALKKYKKKYDKTRRCDRVAQNPCGILLRHALSALSPDARHGSRAHEPTEPGLNVHEKRFAHRARVRLGWRRHVVLHA